MKIELTEFKGMRPVSAPHLLAAGESVSAINVDVDGGDLRALASPVKVADAVGTTISSMYRWEENSNSHWLEFSNDIDFSRSPLADDTYERVYLTGLSEPRFYANDNISTPDFDQDADYIKLGVPAPTGALSASGYTTGSLYRAYVYTYVNRYGEEGPPSPLLEVTNYASGNVTLTGFSTAPTVRAIDKIRVYRTNSAAVGLAEFQIVFSIDLKIYSAADTYNIGDLVVYNGSLFKCVVNNTTGITPVGSHANWDDWYDNVADGSLQPDTLVSEDWEPPPSGLKGLCALPNGVMAGFVGSVIYMSEPYYPHAWPQGTYSDDFTVPLPTPIMALKVWGASIVAMTSGPTFLVSGAQPDQMAPVKLPGLYPCVSKRSAAESHMGIIYASRIGAIVANENGLSVVTESLMDEDDWQAYSPSSISGVFHDGKYIGFYGASAGFVIDFGRKTFSEVGVNAHALHLSDEDGILYVAVDDEVDPNNPPATVPIIISQWAGSDVESLYYEWESGDLLTPAAVNFGAARVVIDEEFISEAQAAAEDNAAIEAYNADIFTAGTGIVGGLAGVGLNVYGLNGDALHSASNLSYGSTVTFKLRADGVIKHTEVLYGSDPFRLPSGFRAKKFSVILEGYVPVKKVEVASGMQELYGE